MLQGKLFVLPLCSLLLGGFALGGQQSPGQQSPGQQSPGQQSPGQQSPGQQNPGHPGQQNPGYPGQQSPGQQNPGQQNPGYPGQQSPGQQNPGHPGQQNPGQQKVYHYPKFGVHLAVMMHNNVPYVYIHKLTHPHGTLARLGLHNGDIIHSIAQQGISSPVQVKNVMMYLEQQQQAYGRPILVPLTIARGGQWYSWQAVLN